MAATQSAEKVKTTPATDPANALRLYLEEQASVDGIGTAEKPAPWISASGKVYVHSRSMLAWAQKAMGRHVTKADVQKALRELGLQVRPATFAGTKKGLGFYQGVPKGVSLKGLPVRSLPRKNGAKKS